MAIEMLQTMWQMVEPMAPLLITMLVLWILLATPMPGRGPCGKRDSWRLFKFGVRREVMERAAGRCEAPILLMWGRCNKSATDADHVYPWSKGGPTIASNGQALCRSHNASKGTLTPPWWMLVGLERRRKGYYPEGKDCRVLARMSEQDRTLRERRTNA